MSSLGDGKTTTDYVPSSETSSNAVVFGFKPILASEALTLFGGLLLVAVLSALNLVLIAVPFEDESTSAAVVPGLEWVVPVVLLALSIALALTVRTINTRGTTWKAAVPTDGRRDTPDGTNLRELLSKTRAEMGEIETALGKLERDEEELSRRLDRTADLRNALDESCSDALNLANTANRLLEEAERHKRDAAKIEKVANRTTELSQELETIVENARSQTAGDTDDNSRFSRNWKAALKDMNQRVSWMEQVIRLLKNEDFEDWSDTADRLIVLGKKGRDLKAQSAKVREAAKKMQKLATDRSNAAQKLRDDLEQIVPG